MTLPEFLEWRQVDSVHCVCAECERHCFRRSTLDVIWCYGEQAKQAPSRRNGSQSEFGPGAGERSDDFPARGQHEPGPPSINVNRMTPRQKSPASANRLRSCAEQRLAKPARKVARRPVGEIQKLVHELQVHQIELEMQNEELRRTQLELETARERLLLPYDAAPVGFFTLDAHGVIREANLAAARLLNVDRAKLTGRNLKCFIAPESQAAFCRRQCQLFRTEEKQTFELPVLRSGGAPLIARLEMVAGRTGPAPVTQGLNQSRAQVGHEAVHVEQRVVHIDEEDDVGAQAASTAPAAPAGCAKKNALAISAATGEKYFIV